MLPGTTEKTIEPTTNRNSAAISCLYTMQILSPCLCRRTPRGSAAHRSASPGVACVHDTLRLDNSEQHEV
jgi:hypothetical protein